MKLYKEVKYCRKRASKTLVINYNWQLIDPSNCHNCHLNKISYQYGFVECYRGSRCQPVVADYMGFQLNFSLKLSWLTLIKSLNLFKHTQVHLIFKHWISLISKNLVLVLKKTLWVLSLIMFRYLKLKIKNIEFKTLPN